MQAALIDEPEAPRAREPDTDVRLMLHGRDDQLDAIREFLDAVG